MGNMKRLITILGILITITILLSGSVIAGTWHYGVYVEDSHNCYATNNILGAPDGSNCTLGTSELELGWIIINLSYGHEMGSEQWFIVFASSACQETYDVFISEQPDFATSHKCGNGTDDIDCTFWTPRDQTEGWLYIKIVGTYGDPEGADPHYGPEIDAVGWYEDGE
jgi:hypothetical protein